MRNIFISRENTIKQQSSSMVN